MTPRVSILYQRSPVAEDHTPFFQQAPMSLSAQSSRQGVLRALNFVARSTVTQHNATARRSLGTAIMQQQQQYQHQQHQHQALLRRAGTASSLTAADRGCWVSSPQQRRCFSAGGRKEDDSDDDFKPQRKPVSDNPDEVSDLIKKQASLIRFSIEFVLWVLGLEPVFGIWSVVVCVCVCRMYLQS